MSSRAEGAGLRKSLDKLISELGTTGPVFPVKRLVTDRSSEVERIMKDSYPQIEHRRDTWHFVRNHTKDLIKVREFVSFLNIPPTKKSVMIAQVTDNFRQ